MGASLSPGKCTKKIVHLHTYADLHEYSVLSQHADSFL